jgi:hypothetical protein
MASNSINPRDFYLESLIITSNAGLDIDLKYIYVEINIFEDMYSNSVSGSLLINDAQNQIKTLPILGNETLTIKFSAPNKKSLSGKYKVYKISDREPDKEKSQNYLLHFCSKEQLIDAGQNMGKSYNGKLISDMVNDIQTKFLNSSIFNLEPTKYLHSFIIPNTFSPFKAINWLSTRSVSSTYNGANFVYFQNKNGYNFTSLERLNAANTTVEYVYGPANIRRTDQGNSGHRDKDLELEQRLILSYSIKNHIDILDNIVSGMYANRVYTYDLLGKKFGMSDYNYSGQYNTFTHIEPNSKYNIDTKNAGSTKLVTDSVQRMISPESVSRFYITNPSDPFPNRVETWLGRRLAQLQEINNITMKLVIPGDSERKIGDVISVKLPSSEPSINGQQQYDTYFQGRYMVTSLRHIIGLNDYITVLEVIKDSVFSPIPY